MACVQMFENNLHPHRRIVLEYQFGELSSFSYLFGNTKPFRINLNDFCISPIRCLFLGSGDLRNVIHLVHTSPTDADWDFHLVDINPSIIARNLVLLRLINNEHCSIDVLWSIWYDFLLEKSVYDCLREEIEMLVNSSLDDLVRGEDRLQIRSTLQAWLNLFDTNVDKIQASEQRRSHLGVCYKLNQKMTLTAAIDATCASVRAALPDEDERVVRRACDEVALYITDGTTGQGKNYYGVNITMLQPNTGVYSGHYGLIPYQSYLPFETTEEQADFRRISSVHTQCPFFSYSQQQMARWIMNYREHWPSVKWHFWCGDALNIALMQMAWEEFDVIHTSNLCDHIDMLNLLVTCVHLLRHRPWSLILTQSMKWRWTHTRFTDYLSQISNGVEISWLPALLGLVCECSRATRLLPSTNSPTINLTNSMDSYDYQVWRLAMVNERGWHVRFDGTEANLLAQLDRMAERCFYTHLTKAEADQGTGHSTALTYYLLLRQYSYRHGVYPEETFAYLFERSCYQFRAYATSLRMIHALLTNDDVYMCTATKRHCAQMSTIVPKSISSPALQLILIESNTDFSQKLMNAIHSTQFHHQTPVVAVSNSIQYDLRTGIVQWRDYPDQTIRFHLIDNFVFQSVSSYKQTGEDLLHGYLEIAARADIHFALPVCFRPSACTTFLIDTQSWFPFARLEFSESVQHLPRSIMAVRDATSSCFADVCDRKKHIASNDRTSHVQLVEAHETASSYVVLVRVNTQHPAWHHTTELASSKHAIIVRFKFSSKAAVTKCFAFACPLNLRESKFESNDRDQTLRMILAKDVAELVSIVTLKTQTMNNLFKLKTATRWPPPGLANGFVLEPRLDLPPPIVIGPYDTKTRQVMDALTAMFTLTEFHMAQRQTGDHLFHDPDFDLRESIRQMFLQAFAGRQRLAWYTTKTGLNRSPSDIRTCGDILLVYEGIFDHESQPLLALSCLDMDDIEDSLASLMTHWTWSFIRDELQVQAKIIREARKNKKPQPSDSNVYDIIATKEELYLMRKLLNQNTEKTDGSHRAGLVGPWHASYVESIQFDSRSKFLSTTLTKTQQITMMDLFVSTIGCQTCKRLPSKPKKPWPKCSRCKLVTYCSVACQTKDWNDHKNSCVRSTGP